MMKTLSTAIVSVAFASFDVFSDDALQLLQTRAQKHLVNQEPTLADGEPTLADSRREAALMSTEAALAAPAQIGSNKRCRGKEVIRGTYDTVEACIAVFMPRGDVVTVGYWEQSNPKPRHRGICMGWGGECKKMGTQLDTVLYDLFPPVEADIEATGDEASAVGDPHFITNTGKHFDYQEPTLAHSLPEAALMSTDAALAAPAQIGSNKRCRGKEVIRGTYDTVEACIAVFMPRGDVVTVGYWEQSNPKPRHRGICMGWGGECKKMGTQLDTVLYDLFPPVETDIEATGDEASAVGDPHFITNTGKHFDYREPTLADSRREAALMSTEAALTAPAQIGSNKRCRGKEVIRGTYDTVEACIAVFMPRGDVVTVGYWEQSNPKPRHRGICMGWGGECTKMGTQLDTVLYDLFPPADEASAVGDPHFITNTGKHFDYSN